MVLLRGGTGSLPVAHPSDVARAHLLALEKAGENDGEAFHLASFHVSFGDYVNAIAAEMGSDWAIRKAPTVSSTLSPPFWTCFPSGTTSPDSE